MQKSIVASDGSRLTVESAIEELEKLNNLLNFSLEEVKNMTLGIEKGVSQLKSFDCCKEDYKKLKNGVPIKNIYDPKY